VFEIGIYVQAGIQADRLAARREGMQACRQAGRPADGRTVRQVVGQVDTNMS
jgi:hypothetical protein